MDRFNVFCFLLVVLCSLNIYAQDKIYKTDNSVVEAKVIEISPSEIKYKLFSNPDGPTYILNKSDAAMIIYQNGQHEVFSKTIPVPITKNLSEDRSADKTMKEKELELNNLKKNSIGMNMFEILLTNITLFYEKKLPSGEIGFKIPISMGARAASGDIRQYDKFSFSSNKTYSSGFDINFYITSRKKIQYFVGPSFQFGSFKYKKSYYSYSPSTYPYYSTSTITTEIYTGQHYAFLINNGLIIHLTGNMDMSFQIGTGFKEDITIYNDYILPKFSGGFNMAYKF